MLGKLLRKLFSRRGRGKISTSNKLQRIVRKQKVAKFPSTESEVILLDDMVNSILGG